MTGAGTTQQPTHEDQSSSPPTAAPNTSSASNVPRSAAAVGAHTFRTDFTHEWWTHGGGTSLGNSHMPHGIHSSAPQSQNQDHKHTHAASSSDNDASKDTVRKLSQSLGSTAQQLTHIETSTSRSVTAAGHSDGFVRPETSDSVISDFIDTDASSLSRVRVNSRGPPSRTSDEDAVFDPAVNDDEDSDDALIEQAMRGSFESITRSLESKARKRFLLLKVAAIFEQKSKGYPEIARMVDGVTLSIKDTSHGNLGRRFAYIVEKLNDIREGLDQLVSHVEAPATAEESGKRKAPNAFDGGEHEQPSVKKQRPSQFAKDAEKTKVCDGIIQQHQAPAKKQEYRRRHWSSESIVIDNYDLGVACDRERQLERIYKDALVVSTDGSYSPQSQHAGAGAAWQTAAIDADGLSFSEMEWKGFAWPLGKRNDSCMSNYSERMAIKLALRMVMDENLLGGRQNLIIQSDSKNALWLIRDEYSGKDTGSRITRSSLTHVATLHSLNVDVTFIWVKGHHRCAGNRVADVLADHGRYVSEQGAPPAIAFDPLFSFASHFSQVEMREFADYSRRPPFTKANRRSWAPAGPLTNGDQLSPRKPLPQAVVAAKYAAHVVQKSSESDTAKGNTSSSVRPDMTETSTDSAVYPPSEGSIETENSNSATTLNQSPETLQVGNGQRHVGATTAFASFSLATPFESSFVRGGIEPTEDENRNPRINQERETDVGWKFCD
ncbi:hypothetical protein KC333_g8129 [Hortaea werneckii]|nr:hypothetical protein KC333_g8129 [Hortaea werneckii]KAI7305537.1 hypothetical protein KC326_g8134 [Hortaea werneckii]